MASLNIWNISLKPRKNLPDNIQKVGDALKASIKEIKNAKLLYLLRVSGENQLVLVTEGDVEPAIDDVYTNLEEGQEAELTGVPVTSFVSFLTGCLKLDPTIATSVEQGVTESCDSLFWVDVLITYTGHSGQDLVKRWQEEDIALIEGQKEQKIPIDVFKVCGKRKLFVLMESTAEEFDQITFTFPLFVGNNQDLQVDILAKRVKFI